MIAISSIQQRTLALETDIATPLLAEVAHDLRSPLTSILFLAETLLQGHSGGINELQRQQLGLIYNAALGLTSLTNDIVELHCNGTNSGSSQPSVFSLNEMVTSICDIVRPLADDKKLTLRVVLPPGDTRSGYAVALSRVLLNLVTNAIKFTDTGFVEISVREVSPVSTEISVQDSGPGIHTADEKQLYQPIRHNGNRVALSTSGLGLVICRRLVEAMGSHLKYETSHGVGTRFFFEVRLPLVAP